MSTAAALLEIAGGGEHLVHVRQFVVAVRPCRVHRPVAGYQEAASDGTVGQAVELLADTKSADGISRPIGQERKVQPLLLCLRPVRVRAVTRDPEHPHPERLELLVAVAQCAQLAAAGIRPVVQVEAEQNRTAGGQLAGRDRSHILLQQRGIWCRSPKLEHEQKATGSERMPDANGRERVGLVESSP